MDEFNTMLQFYAVQYNALHKIKENFWHCNRIDVDCKRFDIPSSNSLFTILLLSSMEFTACLTPNVFLWHTLKNTCIISNKNGLSKNPELVIFVCVCLCVRWYMCRAFVWWKLNINKYCLFVFYVVAGWLLYSSATIITIIFAVVA